MPAKWPVPRLRRRIVQGKNALSIIAYVVNTAAAFVLPTSTIPWVRRDSGVLLEQRSVIPSPAYGESFQRIQILTRVVYVSITSSSAPIFEWLFL